MKKTIISLLLMVAMLPLMANAEYVQLADGVYQDGSTLYICSGVTSLGDLQVNPSEIYCYATIPPACMSNTFTGYSATLHVPAAGMVSYFTTLYWYNFNNILSDAIEPLSVTMSNAEAELEIGQQLSLSATVAPGNATPNTVYWSSTDTSVATVSGDGTMNAVATGECDILATCVDKVAVCHVTVVNPRVTITLDTHEASLLPNHTLTLNATCSPIDVDLAVTSSDPNVAIPRIVNGSIMLVGVAEGTATITVNAADGWGNPDDCVVTVYTELGDTNCDGYINIADVTELIDYLLSGDASQINLTNADTDKNGSINIADVTELIDYLLNGYWSWQEDLTFTVNGVSFKMVYVEGGTFIMGATAEFEEDAEEYEKPIHEVALSDYRIGQTEVTQELWQAVMGNNPSRYTGDLIRPVEQVSWNDCQNFISKLNEMTNLHFRLLTEAEWEYAARGGKKNHGFKYSGSNSLEDVAWYSGNSNSTTHPVATKAPNELGLYDMSGNVYEWCQDWFDFYSQDCQINPIGPTSGILRVNRGGCFGSIAWGGRVTSRYNNNPDDKILWLGLRLALDPDDSPKFRLSDTVVTLLVGESKSVDIINGNGNYTVTGGSDNFTCCICENKLTVTGSVVGTNTVYVTDNASGATAVLTVIVTTPKQTYTVNGVSFNMIDIEGGTFTMGATAEVGNDDPYGELPAHQVTLSSYCIGETEVTQELWQALMGSNPSYYKGNLHRPVESVSWNDCQTFIAKLNQLTGKTFRLPTEAEWEFAARGGNKNHNYKYAGSNTLSYVAWYEDNAGSGVGNNSPNYGTHTVGTKVSNELGLYDMSGNVWEWCLDWYGSYSNDAQTNPVGPLTGSHRVMRGGSWFDNSGLCRVSMRSTNKPEFKAKVIGLRLALDPDISPGPEEHEWIDLGLPSGTLWATCNIGANAPEEYGDYFAWGETETKEEYSLSTYKWCSGSYNTLTKYCTNSTYGTVDNKMELELEDDAAYVNWGENWRMPTSEQRNELYDKCTWTWTTQYGVTGQLVTGPNGNTIFLPAAGYRCDSSIDDVSSWGHYWSRTLASSFPYSAVSVCFSGITVLYSGHDRYEGRSVRPVCVSQN